MVSPRTRTTQQGLLIERIGEETLLYDEECHRAYCLNPLASAIWRHCDGSASTKDIAAAVSLEFGTAVEQNLVILALNDFRRDNLLQATDETSPVTILSRRELAMKLGYSAALLLPMVAAIAAPRAAQAYSGCFDCQAVGEPADSEYAPTDEGVSTPLVDRDPATYGYPEMQPRSAPNAPMSLNQTTNNAVSKAESFFSMH